MAWVEFAAKKDSSIGLSCSFQVAFLFQLFSSFKSAILIFLVDCLTSSQIPYFFMCRLQISVYRIVPSPLFFTLLVFSASASNAEFCILHSAFGIRHLAFCILGFEYSKREMDDLCVWKRTGNDDTHCKRARNTNRFRIDWFGRRYYFHKCHT